MEKLKTFAKLIWATGKEWMGDDSPTLAAALAYYTTFAIAPLLIVVIAIAGFVMGQQNVQSQVIDEVNRLLGSGAADMVRGLIEQTNTGGTGIITTVIALGFLLFGASSVFTQLQTALDKVWHIEHDPDDSIMANIVSRFLGLILLSAMGLLLIALMVASSVLGSLDQYVSGLGAAGSLVMQLLSIVITLGISTVLFAMLFKYLPHAEIEWDLALFGGGVTAFLFIVGQLVIALYISEVATKSAYGAAGALVAILLWLFYSAWILLFGAEFTRVWARYNGRRIEPDEDSKKAKGAEVEDLPDNPALRAQPSS